MSDVENIIKLCFREFCQLAGDSPCGCDACPYSECGEDGCYEHYKQDKIEKLRYE